MYKSNILDTLIFDDTKIVFKQLHALRTQEAFQFLALQQEKKINTSKIESYYDALEAEFANKIQSDECLRIVFSENLQQTSEFSYTTSINKLEKISTPVKLNSVKLSVKLTQKLGPETLFKWEDRERWNNLLKEKQTEADDILVMTVNYDLIETSRFNIFCYDELTDTVFTPPLASGCLNGVFRRFSLNETSIVIPQVGVRKLTEKNIKLDELSYYQLFVGNSVRGLLPATLI